MKKILFPTDFSPVSLNAYVYALRLAKVLDAEIMTLHVYDYLMTPAMENYSLLLEIYKIKDLGDFENFKSEVPKLRAIAEKEQLGRVKVSHMLERGDTVPEILRIINKEKPDFVVIGTKGATGLKEAFLGSIAERIMNEAKTFVMAVPENCKYQRIKNILYLTHFEKMQMNLLYKAHNFAVHFNAHIDALEIKSKRDSNDNFIISKWKDYFKGNDISFNILTAYTSEETVLDIIQLQKINLVITHVHHKNFLEKLFLFSLASGLAYHSTVPVLSIPVND